MKKHTFQTMGVGKMYPLKLLLSATTDHCYWMRKINTQEAHVEGAGPGWRTLAEFTALWTGQRSCLSNHDLRAATTFLPCTTTSSSIMLKFNIIISARGRGSHTYSQNFSDTYVIQTIPILWNLCAKTIFLLLFQ